MTFDLRSGRDLFMGYSRKIWKQELVEKNLRKRALPETITSLGSGLGLMCRCLGLGISFVSGNRFFHEVYFCEEGGKDFVYTMIK